jgi:signal transduction histidine kinase/ActR/RegA family two-component response regulator
VKVPIPNRDDVHWIFIYEEMLNEVLGQINNARLVIVALSAGSLLIALAMAWLITRNIVQPMRQLAQAASFISRGEWNIVVPKVNNKDEIGSLALAFERMSKELKNLYGSLEERVIARTDELETVAKVGAAAAAILELDNLLQTVCDLTKTTFDLYHVQIFLLDEGGVSLRLAAGSGELGQQMLSEGRHIPLSAEQPTVARAGRTMQGLVINDVRNEARFLDNPRLPDTHAEMAVPLKVANKLLGILDLQSNQTDRFSQSELRVKTILSDQIAVAVQNAYLYINQTKTLQALAIAQQKAEEANKAKSLFLSNMSHELRTPLNVIIGYAHAMLMMPQMFNNTPFPAIYDPYLKLIEDNGYYLIGLINDILDLSKIEAGKLELMPTNVDLPDTFRGVLATATGLIKDKPIQLRPDYPENLPLVWADPMRVRQIILNLLSNALKFTSTGSVTLKAEVSADLVSISVIDTGIGIPKEAQTTIFDRFGKINDEQRREIEGTGLGLGISKQLSQMHGGDLVVASKEGKGSKFTFTLPIATSEQLSSQKSNAQNSKSYAVFTKSDVQEDDVCSILLVEDEMSTRELLRRTLETSGYIVVDTHDGAQVLELARGLLPDLIILDLNLPHLNGWEVLQQVKTDPKLQSIPVVVYTASPERQRALQSGATAFIVKPATPDDVLKVVRDISNALGYTERPLDPNIGTLN